jgi:dihydropteroate synthase
MGVLNVTPDSFSDGGRFLEHDAAVHHGLALFEAGADVVDVGGESTRPGGAAAVDEAEERRRVVPVIRAMRDRGAGPISVDTTKASVARAALDAGADIVNDVSGMTFDPAMAPLVAGTGVPVVLMHLRGSFGDMHRDPHYVDVVTEIRDELGDRLEECKEAGIDPGQVIVDPGLGFAKSPAHSLEVVRRLPELAELGRPLLVGPSRKRFIGRALAAEGGAEAPVDDRLLGTAAAVAACILAGAHVVRVHDVREMVQVARVCDAIAGGD